MSRIYCIIGKSGTGKDTVLEELLKDSDLNILKLIPYTTRPRREGEIDGVNYFYVSTQEMIRMQSEGKVIEQRSYNTVHGEWNYFTAWKNADENKNYIVITTQKALPEFFEFFGEDNIHVIYLFLDNKLRLERCITRESQQDTPNYSEVCRRYLADEDDFDEDILKTYKNYTIINTDNKLCEYTQQIKEIIKNTAEANNE